MCGHTTGSNVSEYPQSGFCSLVATSFKKPSLHNLDIGGSDRSVSYVDPELRIVVIPVTRLMLWKLWYDIVVVGNSIVHSLRRGLILDVVGDVYLAEFRLSKCILKSVSKGL